MKTILNNNLVGAITVWQIIKRICYKKFILSDQSI